MSAPLVKNYDDALQSLGKFPNLGDRPTATNIRNICKDLCDTLEAITSHQLHRLRIGDEYVPCCQRTAQWNYPQMLQKKPDPARRGPMNYKASDCLSTIFDGLTTIYGYPTPAEKTAKEALWSLKSSLNILMSAT